MTWQPAVTDWGITPNPAPEVGQYVALANRRPGRVIVVKEVPPTQWGASATRAWESAGKPDPWELRPRRISVNILGVETPAVAGGVIHPWSDKRQWWPLPNSWPVCVDCRCVWPCLHADAHDNFERLLRETDRRLGVAEGVCWRCEQPLDGVTIQFPGENIIAPTMPSPIYHADREPCRTTAEGYERMWLSLDESRTSLLAARDD